MEQSLAYLIGGIALGALVAYFVSRSIYRNAARIEELEQLKLENTQLKSVHDQYREDVRGHFVETAEILNKIHDDHQQLYQSVASNVAVLCLDGDTDDNELLTTRMRNLVELEYDDPDGEQDESAFKPD